MSQHSRTLAILAFGVAIAVSGLALTRQVIAVAGEADAERLNRAILMYIAEKNPQAPIKAFQGFPEVLVAESQRSNLDHCLALAQAEVESEFRFDAVGAAGEIGLFQILPSTAALFETRLGQFRRPVLNKANRDLGDLANPIVSSIIVGPRTMEQFTQSLRAVDIELESDVLDRLDKIFPGPGGPAPEAYAW